MDCFVCNLFVTRRLTSFWSLFLNHNWPNFAVPPPMGNLFLCFALLLLAMTPYHLYVTVTAFLVETPPSDRLSLSYTVLPPLCQLFSHVFLVLFLIRFPSALYTLKYLAIQLPPHTRSFRVPCFYFIRPTTTVYRFRYKGYDISYLHGKCAPQSGS